VALVGADHQVVLSSELQQRFGVFNRIDSHERRVGAEQFRFQLVNAGQTLLAAQRCAFLAPNLGDRIGYSIYLWRARAGSMVFVCRGP